MRRNAPSLACVSLLLLFACKGGEPRGGAPRAGAVPGRIVVMVPAAAEVLDALGAAGRVAGVCDQCAGPAAFAALPRLGSYLDPSVEGIVAMKPDALFVYETQRELFDVPGLEEAALVKVRTESLEDVFSMVAAVGAAVGKGKEAGALAASMRERLEAVRAKAAGRTGGKVKTAVIVDRVPGALQRMFAASGGSMVGMLVELAGGEGCFPAGGRRYPMVALEAVAACRPEVVIDVRPAGGCTPEGKAAIEAMWAASGVVSPSGSPPRLAVIPPDPVVIPGPRVAQAAEIMYTIIAGEGSGNR